MLLAQPVPRKIRFRRVLDRMIPPELIVGTPIRGPEIKAFVTMRVARHAKSQTNETACGSECASGGLSRYFEFNRAIPKTARNQHHGILLIRADDVHALVAAGFHRLDLDVYPLESLHPNPAPQAPRPPP